SLAPIRNHVVDLLPISWIALLVAMTLVVAGFVIRHTFNFPRVQLRLTLAIVIPLLGLWSYCWLSNNAIYVIGRTGCAVLPLFLLAVAAGSEALRPRLQPLVAIAFAGMAVLPLETHYRFDFKSQERMMTEVILAHRAPSEPIIGTYFHWGLLYYLGLYDNDDYMAFPLEEAEHPGWFDCATADTLVLTLDADDLATQAIQRSRENHTGRIWLVLRDETCYRPIGNALDRRLPLLVSLDFQDINCKIRCYAVPP
ncbi:MAG: hypothetical protein GY906_14425, partial [bacterium]|nr:hypothetical protein [bacterium]